MENIKLGHKTKWQKRWEEKVEHVSRTQNKMEKGQVEDVRRKKNKMAERAERERCNIERTK